MTIREKMLAAIDTQFNRNPKERVRCPSLKKMAEYINETFPNLHAEIMECPTGKGRQFSSGVYVSLHYYDGHRLTIIDKRSGKEIFRHTSTGTYCRNENVAKFIFKLEEVKGVGND